MQSTTKNALLLGASAAAVCAGRFAWRAMTGYSFRDKVVVITGGSRGLGLLMARRLAREGAKLALCARDPDELQ
jgi:D-arabinose 1-dehydrogenase-like Zn-dependent alcohol dehydrogenase